VPTSWLNVNSVSFCVMVAESFGAGAPPRSLFDACLRNARAAGFHRLELMATLPGEPLYRALGFSADERIELALPDGVRVPLVRMSRSID